MFFFLGKVVPNCFIFRKNPPYFIGTVQFGGAELALEEGGKVTSGSEELDESDSTFLSKKRSPSCKASFNLHIMFDTSDLVDLYQGVTLLVHYLSANRQIVILS